MQSFTSSAAGSEPATPKVPADEKELWLGRISNDLEHILPPGIRLADSPTIHLPVNSMMVQGYRLMQVMRHSKDFSYLISAGMEDMVPSLVTAVVTQFFKLLLEDNAPLLQCATSSNALMGTSPCQLCISPSITGGTVSMDDDNFVTWIDEKKCLKTEDSSCESSSESSTSFPEGMDVSVPYRHRDLVGARLSARKKHSVIFTKRVPRRYALCMRGVRCMLCYDAFNGIHCVDELVKHTMMSHQSRATPKFIDKLRNDNTLERIIGDGMMYCGCDLCNFTIDEDPPSH